MKIVNYRLAYPDDLPEEPKHQVLLALDQIVSVDVDDVAADGLGRVEGEGQVLHFGVDAGPGLFVHRALVDRIRAGVIDDFPATFSTENLLALLVPGNRFMY